jgi:hypothetical protein
MVSEIYIYIEGGGDKKFGKTKIREGFHKFLEDLLTQARERNIRWNLVASRGRGC